MTRSPQSENNSIRPLIRGDGEVTHIAYRPALLQCHANSMGRSSRQTLLEAEGTKLSSILSWDKERESEKIWVFSKSCGSF